MFEYYTVGLDEKCFSLRKNIHTISTHIFCIYGTDQNPEKENKHMI